MQKLAKRKLEIDYSKLRYARDWGDYEEQKRYWSRRNKLEKAYRDAYYFGDDETLETTTAELLAFYLLYGVRHKTIKEKED